MLKDDSPYFYINHSIPGWVYTKKPLNYEEISSFKLVVVAYDHGHPPLEASLEYVVEVDDVDEFPPVFKEIPQPFEMDGDLAVGSIIGNVSLLWLFSVSHLYPSV